MRRVSIALILFILGILVLLFLAVACSPTTSAPRSIVMALEGVFLGGPGLSGTETPPTNIQVEQMTLATACGRMNGKNSILTGGDPNMKVWLVSMEGTWLSSRMSPDAAREHPFRHYFIIISAETGYVLLIEATQ